MAGRTDYRIVGYEQLRELGKELKNEANPTRQKCLRKELAKGFERATRNVKAEIKKSAIETLPKHGGLNAWVAQLGIKTTHRVVGAHIGVRIVGSMNNKAVAEKRRVSAANRYRRSIAKAEGRRFKRTERETAGRTFGKVADLRKINEGRIVHPVWGRLKRKELSPGNRMAGPQFIRPGFFTRPVTGRVAFQCRQECLKAIEEVRRRLSTESGRRSA